MTRELDRFYIPPRYANAHPAGPPYRYYVRADAEQAVAAAQEVIDWGVVSVALREGVWLDRARIRQRLMGEQEVVFEQYW